jgi:hypothetical protein
MAKPKRMTDDELRALIGAQIDSAVGSENDDIARERAYLLDRYLGEPYGDEDDPDRSQTIDTAVSDTIESITPDLMEVFAASDIVVKFEPVGPEDEAAADQESDVVNHVFMQENNGFLVMLTWFKDALIQKNGFVKWAWDEVVETRQERYRGVTQMELTAILDRIEEEGDEVEVVEQEPADAEDIDEPPMGEVVPFPMEGMMPPPEMPMGPI